MPEITQDAEGITTQAVRIVRVLAATIVATASSGCATLMQPASDCATDGGPCRTGPG